MFFEIFGWVFGLLMVIGMLFITVYVLVSFSDLDVDLSPIEFVRRVNPLILPEFVMTWTLTLLFIVGGYSVEILLNLPLAVWYVYKYYKKEHKLDATKIYDNLQQNKNIYFYKLIFHMCCFFIYLYRLFSYIASSYF